MNTSIGRIFNFAVNMVKVAVYDQWRYFDSAGVFHVRLQLADHDAVLYCKVGNRILGDATSLCDNSLQTAGIE